MRSYTMCADANVQLRVCRVGQNRIYTYIYTVYLVISKPKIPYVHHIYMVNPMCMLLASVSSGSIRLPLISTVRHNRNSVPLFLHDSLTPHHHAAAMNYIQTLDLPAISSIELLVAFAPCKETSITTQNSALRFCVHSTNARHSLHKRTAGPDSCRQEKDGHHLAHTPFAFRWHCAIFVQLPKWTQTGVVLRQRLWMLLSFQMHVRHLRAPILCWVMCKAHVRGICCCLFRCM